MVLKCKVNRILTKPDYPMEGSSKLLKRINPEARVFCAIDWTSGFYQIELPGEAQPFFAFITQQGKFMFCRLPQGSRPAEDRRQHLFLIFLMFPTKNKWK